MGGDVFLEVYTYKLSNKRRRYPQQRGGLTIPFYTNAFTLRTALPAPLCQPQDGKNLVLHVFCSSWFQNLRNPLETRNLGNFRNRQNPSKPGTPQPSKPRNQPSKPRQLSKPLGTQSLEPGTFARPHPSKTGTSSRNRPWGPGTCRNPSKRFPEPGSFPEPPQLAQSTPKSILCKDPIAFCCLGKKP